MRINSINTIYTPLSFKNNTPSEATTPVQTAQGATPADILQFKQAVKVDETLVTKMVKSFEKIFAKTNNNGNYWKWETNATPFLY